VQYLLNQIPSAGAQQVRHGLHESSCSPF